MDSGGSTAPPVAFSRFIDIMNQDQAKDLVRKINTFMRDFKERPNDPEQDSRHLQDFLLHMETAMAKHPLWANSSPDDLDAYTEALEKYLMTKLYDRTFAATPEDTERDQILSVRMAALQFVQPEHLEIPANLINDSTVSMAANELNKMNVYKGPGDKLVCVLNCCRVINNLLVTNAKAEGIGADDFTPLLIFVVVRAQTPHLASNLAYIERYRTASKLASEAQYYFIQLCSAATFIEMVNAGSLKVNPDEFLANMLAHGALTDDQLALMQSQSGSPSHALRTASNNSTGSAAAAMLWPPEVGGPGSSGGSLTMQPLPSFGAGLGAGRLSAGSPAGAAGGQGQGPTKQAQPRGFLPPTSVKDLEAQGAALLASASGGEDGLSGGSGTARLSARHPFAFTSLEQLTVGDVGQLLLAYKELVLKYECLAAALEWHQEHPAAGPGTATAGAATGPSNTTAEPSASVVVGAARRPATGEAAAAAAAAPTPGAAGNIAAAPGAAGAAPAASAAAQQPQEVSWPAPPAGSVPLVQPFDPWPQPDQPTAAGAAGSSSSAGALEGAAHAGEAGPAGAAVSATPEPQSAAAASAPVDLLLDDLLGGAAGGDGTTPSPMPTPTASTAAAPAPAGADDTAPQPAVVDLMGMSDGSTQGVAGGAKSVPAASASPPSLLD